MVKTSFKNKIIQTTVYLENLLDEVGGLSQEHRYDAEYVLARQEGKHGAQEDLDDGWVANYLHSVSRGKLREAVALEELQDLGACIQTCTESIGRLSTAD